MTITDLITQSGKARSEICKQAGISAGYLSLIESNSRRVGAKKVRALAQALGAHPALLRPDLAALFPSASSEVPCLSPQHGNAPAADQDGSAA